MKRWIVISLLIAALLVIGSYLYLQYSKLIGAKWTFVGKRLKRFGFDRVVFEIYYDIDNKGDLEISVSEQEYDIYLNGRFISKVLNKDDVKIGARTISRIPLTVEVKTADFMKVLGSNWQAILLSDRSKVVFTVDGRFTLKMGALAFRQLPFGESFTLADIMNPASSQSSYLGSGKVNHACTCPGVDDPNIVGGWCWCHDPRNAWHPAHAWRMNNKTVTTKKR